MKKLPSAKGMESGCAEPVASPSSAMKIALQIGKIFELPRWEEKDEVSRKLRRKASYLEDRRPTGKDIKGTPHLTWPRYVLPGAA